MCPYRCDILNENGGGWGGVGFGSLGGNQLNQVLFLLNYLIEKLMCLFL